MLKHTTLLMAAAALICAAGCQNDPPIPAPRAVEAGEGKMLKTRDDVKALFPDAEWLQVQLGEEKYMFCANELPSYGNSKIDIHGWVFRRHSGLWESVLTVQLTGVGGVKLMVDPKTCLFSVTGCANNKFLDQSVCTFDLRATE
jgi:hypothetical protein